MKKKLKNLFYLSILLSGLIIVGCELQEGVIEQHNHKQNLKIYEKTFDELMADKKFITSFNKLPKTKKSIFSSVTGRTIMENEYGFTIDNKPAFVIEDFNEISYTFLITRDSTNSNSFENLVLKTDSLQNTSAIIVKYNITSDVKRTNHNSYSFESTKEIIPIVYNNQNVSSKMVYSCVNLSFYICCIPFNSGDTGCHIAQSACYSDGEVTPYSITQCTEYDDGTIDTGGGGGGSYDGGAGPNPIKTNPVLPEFEDNDTPCDELKKLTNNTAVNSSIDFLETKTNGVKEFGYALRKSTVDPNNFANPTIMSVNPKNFDSIDLEQFANGDWLGFLHNHNNPLHACPLMSGADLIKGLYQNALAHTSVNQGQTINYSEFFVGLVCKDYYQTNPDLSNLLYVIRIKDWQKLKSYLSVKENRFGLDKYLKQKYQELYNEAWEESLEHNPDVIVPATIEKAEKVFLEKIKDIGVGLFKFDSIENKWNELTIDPRTKQIKKIPCN